MAYLHYNHLTNRTFVPIICEHSEIMQHQHFPLETAVKVTINDMHSNKKNHSDKDCGRSKFYTFLSFKKAELTKDELRPFFILP